MPLSSQSIRAYHEKGLLGITPFYPEKKMVNGLSFGLSANGYDVRCGQMIKLRPGDFEFVTIEEHMVFPPDLMGLLFIKSTWMRQKVQLHAAPFDAGYGGYGTIGLENRGRAPVIVHKGDPIAQFVFLQLDEATDAPYSGKYQNSEGVTEARFV